MHFLTQQVFLALFLALVHDSLSRQNPGHLYHLLDLPSSDSHIAHLNPCLVALHEPTPAVSVQKTCSEEQKPTTTVPLTYPAWHRS